MNAECTCHPHRDTKSAATASDPGNRQRLAGTLLGGLLRSVLRTALATIFNTGGIKGPTHDVVLHTREVLYTTPAHQDNRVFLKVVPLARNVGRDLVSVGQAHTRHLPKCRVRLFRRGRVHSGTHSAALRAPLKGGRVTLLGLVLAPFPNKLLYCRHVEFACLFARMSWTRLRGLSGLSCTQPLNVGRKPCEGPNPASKKK